MAQPQFLSARHVNPEAGDHAVTADPNEQAAAEAAIRASWREFPYYAQRYGERGWRFSLSDTGWIQTLCHLNPAEARVQVRWLGGVLAARGMPLYLLERHLVHLHRELVQAKPERRAQYDALLSCANSLRESRLAQIREETFERLAQRFEERVRACAKHVANMGTVVVAAVADERAGVANAVESLERWACDAAQFDAVWISAVAETLAAARGTRG
jgi:hypothetical protein